MSELPLTEAIPRFKTNENRFDRFTNGSATETWLTSGGEAVPSIRKFLADKDDEINASAGSILSDSLAAAADANSAKNAAQASATAAALFDPSTYYPKTTIDSMLAALKGSVSAAWDTLEKIVAGVIRKPNSNWLINGNFDFYQRLLAPATAQTIAAGASAYTLDRWFVTNNTNQPVIISQQVHPVGQVAVPGSPKFKFRASFASAPASGTLRIAQRMEGCETLSGKKASARAYITGPNGNEALATELVQSFGTGGAPSAAVVTPASSLDLATIWDVNTRMRKALFNIPATAGKALGSNSNDYLELAWVLSPRQAGNYELSRVSFNEGDTSGEPDPFVDLHPRAWSVDRYCELLTLFWQGYYRNVTGSPLDVQATSAPLRARKRSPAPSGTIVGAGIGNHSIGSLTDKVLSIIRSSAFDSGSIGVTVLVEDEL